MKALFLFGVFFRTGLFAVGGGLATLPFLFDLALEYPDWLNREAIGNMLAVAQSFPGAIGANLAAYSGFRYMGAGGAFTAALGLVTPSVIVIIIVARMLLAFKENAVVKSVFAGFRPAAAGLLSSAAFGAIALALYNPAAQKWFQYIRPKETVLFVLLFILIVRFKKHPVVYIAAAGAAGIILKL